MCINITWGFDNFVLWIISHLNWIQVVVNVDRFHRELAAVITNLNVVCVNLAEVILTLQDVLTTLVYSPEMRESRLVRT